MGEAGGVATTSDPEGRPRHSSGGRSIKGSEGAEERGKMEEGGGWEPWEHGGRDEPLPCSGAATKAFSSPPMSPHPVYGLCLRPIQTAVYQERLSWDHQELWRRTGFSL